MKDVTAEASLVLHAHAAGPLEYVVHIPAADGFEELVDRLEAFDAVEIEADPVRLGVGVSAAPTGFGNERTLQFTFDHARAGLGVPLHELGEVLKGLRVLFVAGDFVDEGVAVFHQHSVLVELVRLDDRLVSRQEEGLQEGFLGVMF